MSRRTRIKAMEVAIQAFAIVGLSNIQTHVLANFAASIDYYLRTGRIPK